MIHPRFDRLARHYVWIEAVTFGRSLQRCRAALIGELTDARRALILGEGDGRFVVAFLKANPEVVVDVVDASPAMIALARRRVAAHPEMLGRVRWHVADARQFEPPAVYDLIVTNFFLDCFPVEQLEPLIARYVECLTHDGRWLVGDFAQPEPKARRLAARAALALMYLCFTLLTRIPAGSLADPGPILRAHGFTARHEVRQLGGFLLASLWRRADPA